MIPRDEVKEILDNFSKTVIAQARRNMTMFSIGTLRKTLYNSFERETGSDKNSVFTSILSDEYAEYGKFVDRGVKGIISGSSLNGWSYRSKGGKRGLKGMPPPSAFKTDKLLRTVSDSQAFGSAVNVFKYGIKPTEFFSRPLEAALVGLPEDIGEAYGIDIERYIDNILNKEK